MNPSPALVEAIDLARHAASLLVKAQHSGASPEVLTDLRRYSREAERRVGSLVE
jgi:hypothetical protein